MDGEGGISKARSKYAFYRSQIGLNLKAALDQTLVGWLGNLGDGYPLRGMGFPLLSGLLQTGSPSGAGRLLEDEFLTAGPIRSLQDDKASGLQVGYSLPTTPIDSSLRSERQAKGWAGGWEAY